MIGGSEMPDMQNCEQLLVVCGSLRTSSPLVLQQVLVSLIFCAYIK